MAKLHVSSPEQLFEHFFSAHERQADRVKAVYAYPDYKAMRTDRACQAFNRRMLEAEQAGAVALRWQRHGLYLEWVRLKSAAALYDHLGRCPPIPAVLSPLAKALLDHANPAHEDERLGWVEIASAVEDEWPLPLAGALAAELMRIRAAPPDEPAFIVSAAGPLGSTKLLDRLPRAALRRIGVPVESYPPPPLVLLTAGVAAPEAVILVENPRAFERAFAATRDLPVAWISTHGLVAMSIADALGGRRYGAPVDGNPRALETLLGAEKLFYWGDLDVAGLMIFTEARKRLPQLRLSALYEPMIDLLATGGGHPYASATDKAGQRSWQCADPQVSPLLDACAKRAVDQEWVPVAAIRVYCTRELAGAVGPRCGRR